MATVIYVYSFSSWVIIVRTAGNLASSGLFTNVLNLFGVADNQQVPAHQHNVHMHTKSLHLICLWSVSQNNKHNFIM